MENRYGRITAELERVLGNIDMDRINAMERMIADAPAVFCSGAGRSGYMMRAFSMRLMHCGKRSWVLGDTSTPAAVEGDVLVIGSGSGETASLRMHAEKAAKLGMNIITVTAVPGSTLGRIADICIPLNAPTPKAGQPVEAQSVQPMGSLFEQSLLLFLDGIVMGVMDKTGLTAEAMFTRHANLE